MIDRWGKPVQVGWAAHELLWLEAAISLPKRARAAAYEDIAAMSGRSFYAVQAKGEKELSQKRLELAQRAFVARSVMVPAISNRPGWPRSKRAA